MKIFKHPDIIIGIDFDNRLRIGWCEKNRWRRLFCGIFYHNQKNTDRYRKSFILKVYRFVFHVILTRFAKWPE